MASRGALERAYFVRKNTGNDDPTKPLNQIKREYFIAFTGFGNATTPINDLEWRWMIKVLANAGITPADTNFYADLWRQMVASISQTPSLRQTENQKIFYTLAP